jgi:hypothetical protein
MCLYVLTFGAAAGEVAAMIQTQADQGQEPDMPK